MIVIKVEQSFMMFAIIAPVNLFLFMQGSLFFIKFCKKKNNCTFPLFINVYSGNLLEWQYLISILLCNSKPWIKNLKSLDFSFSTWFYFSYHIHASQERRENGRPILIPLYYFHLLHKHLGISWWLLQRVPLCT